MQGLIGLAVIFYVLWGMISEINQNVFIALIIFFVILSLLRVYGIILNVKVLNTLSIDLFSLLGVPFSVYVFLRIILTELYPNVLITIIVPFYFMVILTIIMFFRHFDYTVEIHIGKRK